MMPRFRPPPRCRAAVSWLLGFAILVTSTTSTPLDDYEKCATNGFGTTSLICDSDKSLKNATLNKLELVLESLKANAKRPERCTTAGTRREYVGLLQVANTAAVEASGLDLKTNAKQIYDKVGLGNTECDNGVLILFLKDKQQLATYNGNNNFVQLTKTDMDRLHRLAAGKGDSDDGALALQFLKDGKEDDVQRADTWAPVVGITAALVLVLLILALCLAFFIARICCCATRTKKHKYYVTKAPTYKQHEPVYIVTPPPSEHHGGHNDLIYSTPYGPSSPPPQSIYTMPPANGYYSPAGAGTPHHTAASNTPRSALGRSVTPTSTKGVRILDHSSPKSADQTPRSNSKQERINRSGTAASKYSNATYQTVNASSTTTIPVEGSPPSLQAAQLASSSHSPAGNLPFLDPLRKLETQTKEEQFVS